MIEYGGIECIKRAVAWLKLTTGEDRNSLTFGELNKWASHFQKMNPKVYLQITRNDIMWEYDMKNIYMEIKHDKPNVIILQEYFKCPICSERHYKYPDVEKYKRMKGLADQLNSDQK